jgi:hypothetical protein
VPIPRAKPEQLPSTGEPSEQEEQSAQALSRQGVAGDLANGSEQEELLAQAQCVQAVATVLVALHQASEQEQLGAGFLGWQDLARCLAGQSKRPPISKLAPLLEVGGPPPPAEAVRLHGGSRRERARQRNEPTEGAAT